MQRVKLILTCVDASKKEHAAGGAGISLDWGDTTTGSHTHGDGFTGLCEDDRIYETAASPSSYRSFTLASIIAAAALSSSSLRRKRSSLVSGFP